MENKEFVSGFDINSSMPDQTMINQESLPPKKKSKKKFVLAGIAILVVIFAICAVFYILKKKDLTDSERLAIGYNKLFTASENSVANELNLNKLSNSMLNNESMVDSQFTLESLSSADDLSGIGLNIVTNQNVPKKTRETTVRATYRGTSVISGDIYEKENYIAMAVPALFEDVLTLDLNDIEKSRHSSYILKQIPDDIWDNIDFSALENTFNKSNTDISELDLLKYFSETYPEDLKTIKKGITIKKEKDSEAICLSISSSSITLFLHDMATLPFDCKELNSYVDTFINESNMDVTQDELKSEMAAAASTLTAFLHDGLDIFTTLNDKNEITNIFFEYNYKIFSAKINVTIEFNFTGKKHTVDSYDGRIDVAVNKNNVILNIDKEDFSSGSEININKLYTLFVNDEDAAGTINTNSTYNKKTGDFDYNAYVDYNDNTLGSLTAYGTISDIKKGKSFTMSIENLELEIADESAFSISGALKVSDNAQKISEPDGEKQDILKMKKKDFDKLSKKINKNIRKLKNSYEELF